MTVDGTDFKINHPTIGIFDLERIQDYYSYKINHSGLRDEIGVCIQTGHIVWTVGPYKPGLYNDIKIFCHTLIYNLMSGEKVEADKGYRGYPDQIETPDFISPETSEMREMKSKVRARHEMVNGRLKTWGALKQAWRHHHTHHGLAFRCIVIMVQLSMEVDSPVLQVEYHTPRIGTEDRLEDNDELNAARFEFRNY